MPGYADLEFDTLALHAGAAPDPATGARAVPIHLSTSFAFESSDHAASLFNLERTDHVYSRIQQPDQSGAEATRFGARRRHRRYFAHPGFNVLAPDLPGHGKSTGTPPQSVEEAATFVAALLDAAGVAKVDVVGHQLMLEAPAGVLFALRDFLGKTA